MAEIAWLIDDPKRADLFERMMSYLPREDAKAVVHFLQDNADLLWPNA